MVPPAAAHLNPEAREFVPNQPQPLSLFPLPSQYYIIYTTPTAHLDSLQTHSACYDSQQLCPPLLPDLANSSEKTILFDVARKEPTLEDQVEAHKKKEEGFVKQRFYSAIIGRGRRMEGCRRNGYRWPKAMDDEKCGGRTTAGILKAPQFVRHVGYFMPFHNKKHCHPVIPVRFGGEDTTVMIRNIPNKYTREMLVEFLDNHCMVENEKEKEENELKNDEEERTVSAFDFVYLPIDFNSEMNKGYAFVNFTSSKAAWKFHCATNNQKWNVFESNKIREVAVARLQGKEKLLHHFQTMNFPCESEEFLPVCFSPPRDGLIKGEQRTMGRLIMGRKCRGDENDYKLVFPAATPGMLE